VSGLESIPNEEECERWLLEANPLLEGRVLRGVPGRPRSYREALTKRTFSVGVGTIFRSANITLPQWFRLILAVIKQKGLPRSADFATTIGCSRRTAITMIKELKQASVWRIGMQVPQGNRSDPPILPLALVQRIGGLVAKMPTAPGWKQFVSNVPSRSIVRAKAVGRDPLYTAKILRDLSKARGWLTVEDIRASSRIGKTYLAEFKRLMEHLNFPFRDAAPHVMREVLEEGRDRSARYRKQCRRGARTAVIATWRFQPPWQRRESNEKISVLVAKINGEEPLYWTDTLAPTERQCRKLVQQLQSRFGHISNYLTNYRRLVKYVPMGVPSELLDPDPILLHAFSKRRRMANQCLIKQSMERQAASRAARQE
jgi:hypothetical protein